MTTWVAEIKELEKLYESFKGQLPGIMKELEQLIKTQDANVAMLYSRRCLEVIITDLCECELKRPRKTEPLKGIIDKLNSEEKIPSHIITSMLNLNSMSIYGAHPKDFDPEQVKPVLINLSIIIKWYLKYKNSRIISKLTSPEAKHESNDPDDSRKIHEKFKNRSIILFSGLLLGVIFIALIVYFYVGNGNKNSKNGYEELHKTIAVLPFQNMTNDTTWNVWQDGIQNLLITSLSNSEELKVRQPESIIGLLHSKGFTNYASITPSVASSISKKLDANVLIYGSINQVGETIRLNAQLIDSKTEEVFKSFQLDGTADKILNMIDSLSALAKDFLIISKLKTEVSIQIQPLASTESPDAYRYFIYGNNAFFTKADFSTALKLYTQAVAIDSNFTWAILMISIAYGNQGLYEEAKKWSLKAYEKKDQLPMLQKIWTNYVYSLGFETPRESLKYSKQLLEIDDQSPMAYFELGCNYRDLCQYDKAISEFENALELYKKWRSRPIWVANYSELGNVYHKTGQYKKENAIYKKAERDFPNDADLIYRRAILSLSEGNTIAANKYIEKYIYLCKDNTTFEQDITISIAAIYSEAGILDKAEEFYRKALSADSENPVMMNNLAYFLIDKDRNINEGLKFVERALRSQSDNYSYLDCKGWGLYKQGNYQEALKTLQNCWDLRMKNAVYNHEAFLHLEAAKKAVASQKYN